MSAELIGEYVPAQQPEAAEAASTIRVIPIQRVYAILKSAKRETISNICDADDLPASAWERELREQQMAQVQQ